MINYIVRLLLVGLVVYMIPNYLHDIKVADYEAAILVALVMSILNTFVKPILTLLSLPITVVSLGLFYFVVTVIIVYLCDYLLDGFKVQGFIQPLIFSFILSIVNSLVGSFQK